MSWIAATWLGNYIPKEKMKIKFSIKDRVCLKENINKCGKIVDAYCLRSRRKSGNVYQVLLDGLTVVIPYDESDLILEEIAHGVSKNKLNDILLKIEQNFDTFGNGQKSEFNPIVNVLSDKPLQFAAGTPVKEVIQFIIKQLN